MSTQNIYALTDTWNAGGTTFTAIKMNVTDTASAAGSLLMDLQVGGTSQFSISKTGSLTGLSNVLEVRNGTNAQAFRIYNTFTDASNYERLSLGVVTANRFSVQSLAAGTGTQRPLDLNGAQIQFQTAGTARWEFNGSGHLLANIDNAYDIGGNNVNRPRAIYVASGLVLGNSGNIQWSGRSVILSPSNGVLVLQNNGLTDFGRLQFGGATSSFPALKRNATALETKLADDSAYAPHAMQYLDIDDGITAPAAATGRARIYVDTADGDLKVIFADGTIKTIVTDT